MTFRRFIALTIALIMTLSFGLAACQSSPLIRDTTPSQAIIQIPQPAFDAELSNFNYRQSVRFFEFESQRQKLRMAFVLAEPPKPNGKAILLLHGKNFASWYWDRTIEGLLASGYQVLAVDQIGFGKSSKPQSYQFTFQALAQNTRALLELLKIPKVTVIGHSMGGMLAIRFALMFPEFTDKLVLVNPIGLEDWKTVVPYRTVDQLYQIELQQSFETIKEYQQNTYFAGQWRPEYDILIQVPAAWIRHPDYPKVAWNAALTSDMIFTQPVVYEMKFLKPRTLLIIGTRDKTAIGKERVSEKEREKLGNYSILGKKAAKEIPGAKLVEIKEVGHMPQVEAFDTYFKAIVNFL